jgi:hypothetical protein
MVTVSCSGWFAYSFIRKFLGRFFGQGTKKSNKAVFVNKTMKRDYRLKAVSLEASETSKIHYNLRENINHAFRYLQSLRLIQKSI